jgi:photosystem II stability/assembly factor-like uncharacterized protein
VPHPPLTGVWSDVEFRGRTGYAAGNSGAVVKSEDEGATWRDVSPKLGDIPLMGVSFANANLGWAVGFFGAMARTADGGRTWTPIVVPGLEDATFTSVSAVGPNGAWVSVGPAGGAVVIETRNGGASWTRHGLPSRSTMAIAFVSPTHGWAGGDLGVWRHGTTPFAGS